MPWTRRAALRPAVFLAVGLLAATSAAHAQTGAEPTPERVEEPVASSSPVTEVAESVVRLRIPLPDAYGERPEECDWLSYLRYRHRDGPEDTDAAETILIAQPGVLEGAGAFDAVARNTVAAAAQDGHHIEFWALDRRSNCLEDHTGRLAAVASGDVHDAVDYYYNGAAVDGRTFDGYLDNNALVWLQNIGLDQTMRDQYDLMVAELPDQERRRDTFVCGGHSLGGVLTGFFATWDFDGDPATTADAGYNQCSGYFALDSRVQAGPIDEQALEVTAPDSVWPDFDLGPFLIDAGLRTGVIPRSLSAPFLVNAETMNMLGIAGVAAHLDPDGESELPQALPANDNIDTTNQFMFSQDLGTFLGGTPTIRDFRLTNDAVLGTMMDDNSAPLAFIQASVGFYDGGPIVDKDFPIRNEPDGNTGIGGLALKGMPAEPGGPLYTWRNYDEIGAEDDPGPTSRTGEPFTSPEAEVTDIAQLARSLAEHPLDFTEHYFPTRLITDVQLSESPRIARDSVHPDGLTANPTLTVLAGDTALFPPTDEERADPTVVIAPGYQHLDVLTAAPEQNTGAPEPASTALVAFVTP